MLSQVVKEPRRQESAEHIQGQNLAEPQRELVHSQPVSPHDDLQVHIANRAYALYAERGYRQGYALDDWLEAGREILGLEGNA